MIKPQYIFLIPLFIGLKHDGMKRISEGNVDIALVILNIAQKTFVLIITFRELTRSQYEIKLS